MQDYNLDISQAQWDLTSSCTGMGLAILLYRTLVIIVNDIDRSKKQPHKVKHKSTE